MNRDKEICEALGMRECSNCGVIKPISEFWRDKRNKDGVMNACKECRRLYLIAWRTENPEKAREHSAINYRRDVEKHRVHNAMSTAIKYGRIKRLHACSVCGKVTTDLHGHHEDYSKRFSVKWLCRVCHKAVHSRLILTTSSAPTTASCAMRFGSSSVLIRRVPSRDPVAISPRLRPEI